MLKNIFNAIFKETTSKNSFNINGVSYQAGCSISINNDGVFIDGVLQDGSKEKLLSFKKLEITINSPVDTVEASNGEVICMQDAGSVRTSNANIEVKGNVLGSATTSNGSITTSNIGGNATTSNATIKAGVINGDAKTSNGYVYGKK